MIYKPNYLMMTAGPTTIAGNTLFSRSKFFGNPDLDPNFFNYYNELCNKLKTFFGTTKNDVIIMSGEGMLGLDSACASLTEKGDRVLVISNGIFGEGFKELIEPYGGDVTIFNSSWKKSIDINALSDFLEIDSNFKYATIVHCDTPSGILNDIAPVCKLLKSKNILTVVDCVASLGGVEILMDEWNIDIILGASQKVFSSAPGLTILAISSDAWKMIENRKSPIPSFYCNLSLWKNIDFNSGFPYTMPASDILSLGTAIDNLLSEPSFHTYDRHLLVRDICIDRLKSLKCSLYLENNFSPTVTAFLPPKHIDSLIFLKHLREKYNLLLAGSYGSLANKIIRIGHMGENAREGKILYTLDILEQAINDFK